MKKVVICGLGAIGLTIAQKIKTKCELKILADKERIQKFLKQKPVFNGIEQDFDFITPDNEYIADLIIIATKSTGFDSASGFIKNMVSSNTCIISLLNGISSEEILEKLYPNAQIIKSYFIGHSAMRIENSVTQDGIGEIVIQNNQNLIKIFDEIGLNYTIANDIDYSMWLKFTMNIFSNQTSAILNLNFGELKNNTKFIEFAKKIIKEVKLIAQKKGINNLENLEQDALLALSRMCNEGKTSMLQDILAKRETEVEIFAGEIIKLGKIYNIETPYNQVLYDLIKIKESAK